MKELLLQKLATFSSREDKLNFAREFLQELILQIIDRKGYFKNLAFVGGTALRTIYDLPRFSEDLDFSLVNAKGLHFQTPAGDAAKGIGTQRFRGGRSAGK